MKNQLRKKLYQLLALVLAIILLRLLTNWPLFIEQVYANGIYRLISITQRAITTWLPFSLGDVAYAIVILLILVGVYRYVKGIFKAKENRGSLALNGLLSGTVIFLCAYLIFQICWGLNYFRQPLSERLSLNAESADQEQLTQLADILIQRVNAAHLDLTNDSLVQYSNPITSDALYKIASTGYDQSADFNFKVRSTKTSLYKMLMNYGGIGGYYNPFSGESQVNTDPPKFSLPFTICHEMAHQSGISAEEEANFVGYITALNTKDRFFKYSAELEAFMYTVSELGRMDTTARKHYYLSLNKGVKADIKEYRQFWRKYENAIEPYFEWYYDLFLKSNNQPKGIRSYNEFVNLLVGYYEKKGLITAKAQ